jgi:Bacterial extracellular solute-binding protein
MTAGHTGRVAVHRPRRRRRGSTGLLVLLAAGIAAAVLGVLVVRDVRSWASCTDQPVVVRVAVSGEIEPAIQRLGRFFNSEHQRVSGRCAQVAVRAVSPAVVAAALARGRGSGVDAWIPDSTLWLDVAGSSPAAARLIHPSGVIAAQSPLVIAMSRSVAARMPAFGTSVSWKFLLPQAIGGPSQALGLHVQFPDPTQSAAGLATLIHFRKRFGGGGRQARAELARFILSVQVVPPTGTGGPGPPLAALAAPGAATGNRVTVTSEQSVVMFDRSHPGEPLAVRYPAEGTYQLTYPYVLTTADRLTRAVAQKFGAVLRSPYGTAYLRYEGFRTAAGQAGRWPGSYGLARSTPHLLPPPGPGQAGQALRAWGRVNLGTRVLALNDVSSVMATPLGPGGPTLEQVLSRTAVRSLARFPANTQIGVWAFASHLHGSLPYKQIMPVGPIQSPFGLVTRRMQIQRFAAAGTTVPAGAALYGTILAAYKTLAASYQPGYVHAVIVLTAGVENAPGDISGARLVHELSQLYDRRQRIQIIAIMLGHAGNFRVLQQAAAATHGKAYQVTQPGQVGSIFYHAFGRRICAPNCPAGAPQPSASP